MKKAFPVLLVIVSIFIAGCDNGRFFKSNEIPSKLKVSVERQVAGISDRNLTIYAMDFQKEGRTLIFTCPCHISDYERDEFLNVQVEADSFKLTALPDAEYNVKITYWAPTDGNKEIQFQISRDNK